MKPWKTKLLLYLCLFFAGITTAMSQLSGTINTYTKVTAVDYLCNFITVNSTVGFAAGDKVLIIQMQGATITQTNNAAFGDIASIGDAGNYEFAIIDHFSGNDVYFSKTLLRTYTPSGSVQLVSVPQYGSVSIDGELTSKVWDGNTGGILVLESSDVLTLHADISVSESGFTGGQKSQDGGNCNTYPTTTYYTTFPTVQAGQKGQGIAAYIAGGQGGRGKQANGGGGGGSHNTGGGGGGNYGTGGRGGDPKCGFNPYGLGSVGLSSTYYNTISNKIFMGGGGGGGQANNGLSYNGGNGGGIIIIKAVTLTTNGYAIKSNGGSVASYYTSSNPAGSDNGDGNSGGGAGGTILLDVLNYSGTTLVITIGGRGGDTGYLNNNFGPGGGGGGGVVWSAPSSTLALISSTVSGGSAGISGSGTVSGIPYGNGNSFGAVNGAPGGSLSSLAIPQSTSSSNCALPVELLQFKATAKGKYTVQLNWSTASEINNAYFSLEKSTDGNHFSPVAKVAGQETSRQQTQYSFTDEEVSAYQLLYYRLRQTDTGGRTVDLGIRKVYATEKGFEATVYPNPCKDQLHLPMLSQQKEDIQHIVFVHSTGEIRHAVWEEKEDGLLINTTTLSPGLYSLVIYTKETTQHIKVIKEQ